jgi:transposase-like protein
MKRIFKTKYPPSVIEKALRDYQSSQMTTERIAKKYRVCTASLTVWAKRAGLPLRQRGRRRMTEPNSRQRAIIEMAGILKYSAVANAFGMTKQGVYRIVRRWKRPAEADRTNESPTAQLPKPPVGSSNSLTDDDITGDIERVIAKAVNPYVDESNPMLHFDELKAECRAKLAKILHDGCLAKCPTRGEGVRLFED